MAIARAAVAGCGLMGSGIAEILARSDIDTLVFEVDTGSLERGRRRVESSLDRAVAKGKVNRTQYERTLSRLRYTTNLDALGDRELVIEAIVEDEDAKGVLFARLDKVVEDPSAILASNTSSIPIMKLAMATSRPEQVIGLHFFNPVPVLRLVELVTSLLTSDDTADRARTFAREQLNKVVVPSPDRAGFVVNALLIPFILSAIRMVESGFALAEEIDLALVEGCAHPMGPLKLADLIGLDTTKAVAESLYQEFREQLYSPPPLLSRMVDAGLYGRKSGQGFYSYVD
jgi:3-hydroxybutyryl-CoA dehydrogenase